MIDEKRITEIVTVLRSTSHLLVHKADFEAAADLIEALQAQLDATITGQETLQRALAESQRREQAAVAALRDMVAQYHTDSDEIDTEVALWVDEAMRMQKRQKAGDANER